MPVVPADRETVELAQEVRRRYHPDLEEVGVTVGVLMAHAKPDSQGEVRGPALKHQGHPALATIKINSVDDRLQGKPDVTIKLDGDQWGGFPPERQVAILDHEWTHIVVARDESGAVKTDDANRPKLKMRLHDLQVGGFAEVAKRHSRDSVEVEQYAELHRRMVQLDLFPGE